MSEEAILSLFCGKLGAAEDRAHARQQLGGRKGLDEVVVRPQVQALDAVLFLALGGQHDDRNIGEFTNSLTGGETVEARHHDVQQNQIGRHTSELQSPTNLVCRLLLEKKK